MARGRRPARLDVVAPHAPRIIAEGFRVRLADGRTGEIIDVLDDVVTVSLDGDAEECVPVQREDIVENLINFRAGVLS